MSVSLYRKYRPKLFREVVGQDSAMEVLRESYRAGRLGHAYLFSGPRGCGKTTAARLLAKTVYCRNVSDDGEPCCECESCRAVAAGNHMDVMEIDGASNRGIDQIRELKSHVGLAPFTGGTKVYILDEVHMLTPEAFNALLKTLEEPPQSVMFIFATTEPHKVPVTIRSRCQHIPFHRITAEVMAEQLARIASEEGVSAGGAALWEIARGADGALRDAISLFEQAMAMGHGEISSASVTALFGGGGRAEMERWIVQIREHPDGASGALKRTLDLGVSPERFLDGLFPLLRDMWTFALWGENSFAGASLSDEEKDFLRREAPNWNRDALKRAASAMASLYPRARLGLRNDVFSGLLLFELMGALDDKIERQPPSEKQKQPKVPPARPRAVAAEKTPADEKTVPAEIRVSGSIDGKRALLDLAPLDVTLASAMIDVRILPGDGQLTFDFSGAPKTAETVLSGARARSVVLSAFGLVSEETPAEPAEENARTGTGLSGVSRSGNGARMAAETISVRLGADILMSKRLDSEDDET
ncbi:MAG: DNA polymerase III subunit gamma/tau, partial [Synergistaceae bacterium]|nr:DNA polymerase III subunit gamma/tau [Synergistaceae bacterium]